MCACLGAVKLANIGSCLCWKAARGEQPAQHWEDGERKKTNWIQTLERAAMPLGHAISYTYACITLLHMHLYFTWANKMGMWIILSYNRLLVAAPKINRPQPMVSVASQSSIQLHQSIWHRGNVSLIGKIFIVSLKMNKTQLTCLAVPRGSVIPTLYLSEVISVSKTVWSICMYKIKECDTCSFEKVTKT